MRILDGIKNKLSDPLLLKDYIEDIRLDIDIIKQSIEEDIKAVENMNKKISDMIEMLEYIRDNDDK